MPENFKVIGSPASLVWALQAVPKSTCPGSARHNGVRSFETRAGRDKDAPLCSVLHPSSTWRHQDGFRSYSPGRLPAGWVRMDHGPEPEFCKIKAAERRDHIASLIVCGLFKEG